MDGGFDYINGDLGFYIQKTNGMNLDNNPLIVFDADPNETIVEVHYIGSPITTVKLEVSNLLDDLDSGMAQVEYVANKIGSTYNEGDIQANTSTLASVPGQPVFSTLEYEVILDADESGDIFNTYGLSEWSMQQGGLDPAYGIISIPVSADILGALVAPLYYVIDTSIVSGSINMQASLYYDIISPHQDSMNADNTPNIQDNWYTRDLLDILE